VILRFNGDPGDLAQRFETARQLWIEAQEDYVRPIFYARCTTKNGIVVVTAWPTKEAHKAFGPAMRPHLETAGSPRPDSHEHLRIDTLGWA
jgi:hypothetical protein